MRRTAMAAIALGLAVPIAVGIYKTMETAGDRVGSFIAGHDLGGAAGQIREADVNLTEMVRRELGQHVGLEREIDFLNPTEEDVRFLLDMLRDGEENQRQSSARALVEISDPRFVRSLLRASTSSSVPQFYCVAAQEILRHQTRSGAAEWILDSTEDPSLELGAACTAELQTRLTQLDVGDEAVLGELLFSERPRVLAYALRSLPSRAGGSEVARRVEALREHSDPAIAGAARRWSEGGGVAENSGPSMTP